MRIPAPGDTHILQNKDAAFYAPWLILGCTNLATWDCAESFIGVSVFIREDRDETLEGNLSKLVETLSNEEQAAFRASCDICLHVLTLGFIAHRNVVGIKFVLRLCAYLKAVEVRPRLRMMVDSGTLAPWGNGIEEMAKELLDQLP